MRLAQIILPMFDNDGEPTSDTLAKYAEIICNHFGGFTQYEVYGLWIDETGEQHVDNNFAFHIAIEDNDYSVQTLRQIAEQALGDFRQKAIMIVLPSGNVEFVSEEK